MLRTTVVVGGARGIGAAAAAALAERGDAVLIVDRADDDPRLPYRLATAGELHGAVAAARSAATGDAPIWGLAADASDEAALAQALADAERRTGGVDAVVVTAGVIAGGVPLWEMPREQLDAVLDGNLGTVLAAARTGIPALLRRPQPRQGRFVAVGSTAAARGLPMISAYGAAKAAVSGLVRGLAAELRGSGVTANVVSPGSTATPILDESARLYELPSAASFASQQPIERLIAPTEVAALLAWLAGPDSGAVTGADYAVDGGLSI